MPKHCSGSSKFSAASAGVMILAALLSGCAGQQRRNEENQTVIEEQTDPESFSDEKIFAEAQNFFGRGAQGLADVMNRVIADNGTPDGYITGEEAGASAGIGLRYGRGTLYLRDGKQLPVYWRGPSIGIDVGGSAAKAFILVYRLPYVEALFQRFGGVEGSLYFVGGVGVNYNRSDDIVLAPVRFGVGWRQGVNIGYLHLSPERSWLPF
jgi:hypothetical protein